MYKDRFSKRYNSYIVTGCGVDNRRRENVERHLTVTVLPGPNSGYSHFGGFYLARFLEIRATPPKVGWILSLLTRHG